MLETDSGARSLSASRYWPRHAPAQAQWDPYPMKNVPRTADGKVDLNAPARRTPDGKPDLSGFWMPSDVVRHLLNLAADMKPEEIPLQPWAAEVYKERIETNGKDHPGVRCWPSGIPEKLNIPDGLKLVQTPDLIILLHESRTIYRQIFLDGRPHPKNAQPTWMGYSIGRWDGDTLVVDTIGQNGRTWLDMRGLPGTEALHVIERYTRPKIGQMNIDVTIDDPKAYTKPWTVKLAWTLQPDTDLIESICEENSKDLRAHGREVVGSQQSAVGSQQSAVGQSVVRYLRMLSNSLVAALLGASYVTVLVLQLNPTMPLYPPRLVPLALTVGLFYAAHLTVIFYVWLVVRQVFARELFSPAWTSVAVLSWLGAAAAAAGAALMWANLRTFTLVLPDDSVNEIARGMLALIASACLFVVVGQLRAQFPHLRRVWALLLVLVAASSIAAPLSLRGRARVPVLETRPLDAMLEPAATERPSRVTILAIDAGSLDLITGAAADGRLPNFGRVLDAGAVMHLATIHPTSAEAVWTAVATGKLPQKNGVRSAAVYDLARGGEPLQLLPDYCFAHALVRFGLVAEVPHTSAALRTRPFWSILTALGIPVGVVGWPLTQPAPVVRGYLVSDAYPRLAATPSAIDDSSSVYPPDMKAEAAQALESVAAEAPAASPRRAVRSARPRRASTAPSTGLRGRSSPRTRRA